MRRLKSCVQEGSPVSRSRKKALSDILFRTMLSVVSLTLLTRSDVRISLFLVELHRIKSI